MPILKKKTFKPRYGRKKKFQRSKAKPTFRAGVSYGVKPDPFPTRLFTRLKYVNSQTLTGAVSSRVAGNEQAFRLNSIYDPDFTGTGYNAMGWANLAALYERYIVNGAKVEIQWSNPSGDGMVGFASLNQTTVLQGNTDPANYNNMLVYSTDVNNTGSQKSKMKFYVRPWNLIGLSKLEWKANKASRSSAMTGNPSVDLYLRLACSGNASSQTIHVTTKIIYYVECYNRVQPVRTAVPP